MRPGVVASCSLTYRRARNIGRQKRQWWSLLRVVTASMLLLTLELIEEALHLSRRVAVSPTSTATSLSLLHVQYADHHGDYQRLCLLDGLADFGRKL